MSTTVQQVSAIKNAFKARIQSAPLVVDNSLVVVTDDEANLAGVIDAAIKGGTAKGIYIIVTCMAGKESAVNALGPLVYQISVDVHEKMFVNRSTPENAEIFNGTNIYAEHLAEHVRLWCKGMNFPGLFNCIPIDSPLNITGVDNMFGDWHASALCNAQSLITEFTGGRVQDVRFSTTQGVTTMSCATTGAAIYYTTDGTYPSAQNSTATLYTAPTTISGTINAVAYKANCIASNVTQTTI